MKRKLNKFNSDIYHITNFSRVYKIIKLSRDSEYGGAGPECPAPPLIHLILFSALLLCTEQPSSSKAGEQDNQQQEEEQTRLGFRNRRFRTGQQKQEEEQQSVIAAFAAMSKTMRSSLHELVCIHCLIYKYVAVL